MKLSDLATGQIAVIAKVNGHGSFRKRLIEMGFIAGKHIKVILNAPLKDPIEYEILGYKVSLRREEAKLIEVVSEAEAVELISKDYINVKDKIVLDEDGTDQQMTKLAKERHNIIKVALVGNPNCGKTSLFNIASGSHEHVGNYSGVTVDAKEGTFDYKGYKIVLVDLPGTYSLSFYSPEELYVRKNLINNAPDIVINVVDASNIERNLYLTTQLIDMNLRLVMALNMYDELEKRGDKIDTKQLGYLLGMPICPTISKTGQGINDLFDVVIKFYNSTDNELYRHIHVWHGREIENSIEKLKNLIKQTTSIRTKYSTRYLAIKYLEDDKDIKPVVEELYNRDEIISVRLTEQKHLEDILRGSIESAIVDAKYGFIQGALKETYKPNILQNQTKTLTDKIDAVVTNKWLAFPIFIALLYIMFQATFTVGQYPMDWIDAMVNGLGNMVSKFMVDGWLKDMVVDGVIAGVGSVLVFLPNIMILYFFISVMEDFGYMARAAFIVDKLMHKIGLHGKSFIPMVMGFGCNVPAIMATRTIESRKSRFITMSIIPFMSCAGRLPVFVLLAGAFFPTKAGMVLFFIYLLGIVLGIITAGVMGRFIKDDDLPFVMELPPYRIPTSKAIWRHTWEKGKQYLQKMATTILIASIIIWFLGYYPKNTDLVVAKNVFANLTEQLQSANNLSQNTEVATELQSRVNILQQQTEEVGKQIDSLYEVQQANSYIGVLGKSINPIMEPLGFNWKMNVSLLTGIAAKELVVSTLGVMYSEGAKVDQGQDLQADTQLQSALASNVSWAGALAFMVFVLLYFPCVATFIAIKNESGSWKMAIWCCVYTMFIAWVFAFATYHIAMLF